MNAQDILRAYDDFTDHSQFAQECLSVREKSGQIIPYKFQPSQNKFWAAIKRQRDAGKPIRQCWLKSRQVFGSTTVAGYFFQDLAFRTGRHARIIAHEKDAAGDIFEYYKTFDEHYKPFRNLIGKSPLVGDSNKQVTWANDSWARVLTAGNVKTGRSATVQLFHCSEMAFWPNAAVLYRGIMGSIPNLPDTAVIVESTANGIGDEFHGAWLTALESPDWEAVFFAWHEHPEYVREIEGSRAAFQDSLSRDERTIMERFALSLEQMNWRRWKIGADFSKDPDGFKQEFPADPEEAFISSGRPRFSMVELGLQPIIDKPAVGEIQDHTIGSRRSLRFVLSERGALHVYTKPQEGRVYTIGADTAEGIDSIDTKAGRDPDWCVACVLDAQSGEQVAKYRARDTPAEFGRQLKSLGAYYNWAFLVVEVNNTGIATMDEIQRGEGTDAPGYPGELIYKRDNLDPNRIERSTNTHLWGWKTTTVTRPQLIHWLDDALREGAVTIRDAHTKDECIRFIVTPSGKAEAQKGAHDDEVIALALAVVGIQSFPWRLLRERQPLQAKPLSSFAEHLIRKRR